MSSGVVLLTFLSVSLLPMSNTQIGFAISLTQLLGALSQPGFGIAADRRGGRWLGAGGLAWVVVMYMLSLLAAIVTRNYWLVLIPFALMGLGSGAVHPVGALHAAESDKARSTSSTAYFFLMGQLGLATGPALVGLLLDMSNVDALATYTSQVGLPGLAAYQANVMPIFLLSMLAIPGISLMLTSIPVRQTKRSGQQADDATPDDSAATASENNAVSLPLVAFSILILVVVLRSLASPGLVNFIPALFQDKGWTPAQYGLVTSFFWVASGVCGVIFGNLADRFDKRYVMMLTMVLSAPAFYLLPLLDGAPAFLMAIIAGGFVGGAQSIIIVLAQSLLPRSKGFASGMTMGLIFGTGALGSLAIGSLADAIGLATAFQWVAGAIVVAGLLVLLLPAMKPRPVASS